jgi:hypothetical protein
MAWLLKALHFLSIGPKPDYVIYSFPAIDGVFTLPLSFSDTLEYDNNYIIHIDSSRVIPPPFPPAVTSLLLFLLFLLLLLMFLPLPLLMLFLLFLL